MGKAPAPDPWKDTKSLPRQAGRPHTRRSRLKRSWPPWDHISGLSHFQASAFHRLPSVQLGSTEGGAPVALRVFLICGLSCKTMFNKEV
jgi:hypothetical protein